MPTVESTEGPPTPFLRTDRPFCSRMCWTSPGRVTRCGPLRRRRPVSFPSWTSPVRVRSPAPVVTTLPKERESAGPTGSGAFLPGTHERHCYIGIAEWSTALTRTGPRATAARGGESLRPPARSAAHVRDRSRSPGDAQIRCSARRDARRHARGILPSRFTGISRSLHRPAWGKLGIRPSPDRS